MSYWDIQAFIAARFGDANRINMLLKMESAQEDIDVADGQGWTPLMLAAHCGHANIVEKLLDAGADPRLQNRDGNTAFDLACSGNHSSVCLFLKRRLPIVVQYNTCDVVVWRLLSGEEVRRLPAADLSCAAEEMSTLYQIVSAEGEAFPNSIP